jgi:hypothetical protein
MTKSTSQRKNRLKAAPYLLGTFIFFIGGFMEMEEDRFYFSIVLFSVSLLNLLVIKTSDRNLANFIVMVLNAILALILTSVKILIDEKEYFQYVWFLVFILFSGVAIISLVKYKNARAESIKPVEKNDSSSG